MFVSYYVVGFAYQIVYYRFFHPLSKFPGPFWASVTRLWTAYHSLNEDESSVLYEAHQKYGPVIRVTPTQLDISDPTRLPEIYHRYADKTKYYISGSFGKEESIFQMQEQKKHAMHRKIVAGPVSSVNCAMSNGISRRCSIVSRTSRKWNHLWIIASSHGLKNSRPSLPKRVTSSTWLHGRFIWRTT
jgi:hypothetical protein